MAAPPASTSIAPGGATASLQRCSGRSAAIASLGRRRHLYTVADRVSEGGCGAKSARTLNGNGMCVHQARLGYNYGSPLRRAVLIRKGDTLLLQGQLADRATSNAVDHV